jgi:hypothetical protein
VDIVLSGSRDLSFGPMAGGTVCGSPGKQGRERDLKVTRLPPSHEIGQFLQSVDLEPRADKQRSYQAAAIFYEKVTLNCSSRATALMPRQYNRDAHDRRFPPAPSPLAPATTPRHLML